MVIFYKIDLETTAPVTSLTNFLSYLSKYKNIYFLLCRISALDFFLCIVNK